MTEGALDWSTPTYSPGPLPEGAARNGVKTELVKVSMSHRLASESESTREKRLRHARERSTQKRATETQEEREKRLKRARERSAQRRSLESADQREKRLRCLRERMAEVRQSETEEMRERRLEQTKQSFNRRKSVETEEERETRLRNQRERMAEKRRAETLEMRAIRLERAREREALRRMSETQEQRERRLQYSREQAALCRGQETPEQRERRLEASRNRVAQRRRKCKGRLQSESSGSVLSDHTPSPLPFEAQECSTSDTIADQPRVQKVTRRNTCQSNQIQDDVPEGDSTAGSYDIGDASEVQANFDLGGSGDPTPFPVGVGLEKTGPLQEGGVCFGGMERRSRHPDFSYSLQRQGHGIHTVILNTMSLKK